MLDLIQQSTEYIQARSDIKPLIGIVLGSGLGGLSTEITVDCALPYNEIPNFPVSTVEGHQGKLLMGTLEGVPVVALQGRFHYYEGYSLKETTFPIRIFKALGVQTVLLSNASGGLHPKHQVGDLMVINDHIHLFPDNPLRGKNYEELGPRFPDMSEPYATYLIDIARDIDTKHQLGLHYGVYAGTPGPNYETPAEYRYFSIIGADAVGMSTTSETIVAVHGGMQVFAVSVISDLGVEGKIVEISHEEVQEVAAKAGPKLSLLFKEMTKKIASAAVIA
jgi:purine-nucleoside phosphorylase